MGQFLVIATQGGGCDYTIGCGVKYWYESAGSMSELIDEIEINLFEDDGDSNYSGRLGGYESGYDTLEIIEVGDTHSFDLDALRGREELIRAKAQARESEAEERAELKRLQNKYGEK